MPRIQKLEDSEIEHALAELGGWTIDGGKLFREFAFSDFSRTIFHVKITFFKTRKCKIHFI